MAQTTTPILAATGITLANRVLFNGKAMDWKIPIAGLLLAAAFAGGEAAAGKPVVRLSWLVLLTSLVVSPPAPKGGKADPTFVDNLLKWSA